MNEIQAVTAVERIEKLKPGDLSDLCDAADAAISDGGGFGWVDPPPRHIMERYWQGLLMVPGRYVFVARLDGVIAGSAQLVLPPRNNEAQAFAGQLTTSFMAPWARGHGLARMLTLRVEEMARALELRLINLDVRETQTAAISLYNTLGYVHWATHPHYAVVHGQSVQGLYFYKDLSIAPAAGEAAP